MAQYGDYGEQRYRQQFEESFDIFAFNIQKYGSENEFIFSYKDADTSMQALQTHILSKA
jgi:hypothetical protein